MAELVAVEAVDTVAKIPLSLSTKLPFVGNGFINASVNLYLSGNK